MMSLFLYRFPFTYITVPGPFPFPFPFPVPVPVPIPVPIPDSGFRPFQTPRSHHYVNSSENTFIHAPIATLHSDNIYTFRK